MSKGVGDGHMEKRAEHTSGLHHVRTSGPDHVRTFDVHTTPLLMNVNFFYYKEKVKQVSQKKKKEKKLLTQITLPFS
jgi:hypothetical protein